MLDRQRVEAILRRRFAGAIDEQVAAAANAIMGLDEEREECRRSGVVRSSVRYASGPSEDDVRHVNVVKAIRFTGEDR